MTESRCYTVRDVCDAMEELAPLGWAYSWDKSGLAIGDPAASVASIVVALTVTPEVLRAAVKRNAGMIVTHHPPIMEPLQALRTDDPETRLLLDLASAGIACYAAHTNLDVAPGGVNDLLADRLGLVDTKPLLPAPNAGLLKLTTFVPEPHLAAVRQAVCDQGAGGIGDYTHCTFSTPGTGTFLPGKDAQPFSGRKGRVNEESEHRFEVLVPEACVASVVNALIAAHPYEEVAYDLVVLENRDPALRLGVRGQLESAMSLATFAEYVRDALKVPHVRFVGAARRSVRSIAVLGGSGGGDVGHMPPDIDVLVTGDVKYHQALTARAQGLAVVDAGHAATERLVVPALCRYLKRQCPGLAAHPCPEPELFQVVTG
ncbi:MAG: Nif3-like dinuclear metal center hexameric protein [bacterium]|nr:Nif3-like dinuclear metal center hexameric protein [bacterium]